MFDVSDDLYALLEVSPLATQEEIKTAYRAAAKKYHPDVYHGADAQQRFQKINAAYDVLKDPIQRASYDSFINSLKTGKNGAPGNGHDDTYDRTTGGGVTFDPVDIDHNLYTELDLPLYASPEEIKKAFMDLSEKYDPNESLVPNAREKIRKITLAYQILSDPAMKQRYDYLLKVLLRNSGQSKTNRSSANNSGSSANQNTYGSKTGNSYTSANTSDSSNSYNPYKAEKTTSTRRIFYDHDDDRNTNDQKQYVPSDAKQEPSGCVVFLIAILAFVFFIILIDSCSTQNRSNSRVSNSGYTTSVQTKSSGTAKTQTKTPRIIPTATALKTKTTVPTAVRKRTLTPTPTVGRKRTLTPTPTPTKTWSFDKTKINIKKGESVELQFTTPQYAIYTYSLDRLDRITLSQKDSNTLIITGIEKGTAKIYLKDNYGKTVAECSVSVADSSKTPTVTPQKTPVPLPHKSGGYTENELIENGHVGVPNADGTIRYPGFYQAPNGNYYPTGN